MYINVIWVAFRYLLRVFNICRMRYVCYRFWALAVSIGTQLCKHCCQSRLAHLMSKNRNSISRRSIFLFLHFTFTRTVKINILLLYNLGMRYRLNLLWTPFSRYWNLIIYHLNFWSRVKIHGLLALRVNLARDTTVRHYLLITINYEK